MTISLEQASIQRAQAALTMATRQASVEAKRRAFVKMAWELLQCESGNEAFTRLKRLGEIDPLVEKAAPATLADPTWSDAARELADAFVASVHEFSLLDALKRGARVLPRAAFGRLVVASAATGDVVTEGDPIPVKNLNLASGEVEPTRSSAMVVLSRELVQQGGQAVLMLFESELAAAVGRASNTAILSQLIDSNTVTVQGSGDPLADLRVGLRGAGPSTGYVVAAPAGSVADLATHAENRGGMSVRGGTFAPGVEVVAVDHLDHTVVIPSNRLSLWDGGIDIRPAEHAVINLKEDAGSPAELVSLWQENLFALRCERAWSVGGDYSGVVIVEGQS